MRLKVIWRRPLLTLTQLIVLLFVIAALIVVLDLNRRAKAGRLVGAGEDELRAELAVETTPPDANGEILIDLGLLTPQQLGQALAHQMRENNPFFQPVLSIDQSLLGLVPVDPEINRLL